MISEFKNDNFRFLSIIPRNSVVPKIRKQPWSFHFSGKSEDAFYSDHNATLEIVRIRSLMHPTDGLTNFHLSCLLSFRDLSAEVISLTIWRWSYIVTWDSNILKEKSLLVSKFTLKCKKRDPNYKNHHIATPKPFKIININHLSKCNGIKITYTHLTNLTLIETKIPIRLVYGPVINKFRSEVFSSEGIKLVI